LLAADLTLLWRRSILRRRAQAFAYEVGASIFDISQGTLGLEGFGTQHCRSPAVAFPPLTQGAHSAALLFLSDDWPKKLQSVMVVTEIPSRFWQLCDAKKTGSDFPGVGHEQ
jgi:hypothetical protein